MATFSMVPRNEAERLVMPPRRATLEQYCQYVRAATPEEAGRLELGPDDKPITERSRLKAAAKAEGITLMIRRTGNTIVFWEGEEAPPSKVRPSGGRGRQQSK